MNFRFSALGWCLALGLLQTPLAWSQTVDGTDAKPAAPVAATPIMADPSSDGSDSISLIQSNALSAGNRGRVSPRPQQDAAALTDRKQDTRQPVQRIVRNTTPSLFQRFVQDATGRLLPVYGSELFTASDGDTSNTALPVPPQYILGPGDEVRIQIWGPFDYVGSRTLDRNGQITLPKVGTFSLTGVAVRDLETVLRNQLNKVFTNFSVNASLGRLHSIQVYVVGQAQAPGSYQLSSLSTLVTAMFASGGPNANGSMRAIQLSRGGSTLATLDLYDFIAKGDKAQDLPLQNGDVIVIPPVGPRVALTGALDQAAIYELKPGAAASNVGDLLALSGGVPTLVKPQKALLERIEPGHVTPRQVAEIKLDANGLQTVLHDGDVLTLLAISQAFSNAVTLQGAVAEPLRSPWFEGMRVSDLIPAKEALISPDYYKRKNLLVQSTNTNGSMSDQLSDPTGSANQINWEYAVIERMDKEKLSTQLIPFNLGKAVISRESADNLPLLPGDVVTVLNQKDLRLPQDRQMRLVRVEGEVAAPGVYQVQAGETLPQLLRRIGGLTAQAYVYGIEFSRESVRKRQQDNLEVLIRRLEAQAQGQASTVASNTTSDTSSQAQSVLQQQQTQLKGQIERLRAMRSNGRMALELEPGAQSLAALPGVSLEEGDRILVPSVPSFVAAFGSVNNENVFLFKAGKTVGDVIRSAGLTEDAEPDQAFVLRADGSIVARRDRGGLFGGGFESLGMMPGDTLVVPAKVDRETRYNAIIRGLKDWTQILANMGLGLVALKQL